MEKYTFILLVFGFFFQSCNKDNDFATEIENQSIEQVDPASDGTKIKGKHFENANITEIVPQEVLDKLNSGVELTREEQLNMDKVSFEDITYQGETSSLEEAYGNTTLMDVYFNEEMYTLIVDKSIYLFDTEEEVEHFRASLVSSRNTVFTFHAKFWEHNNFVGANLHYYMGSTQTTKVGYMLPSNWQNRASSLKIWNAKITNRSLTSELKYAMIRKNDRIAVYPINYHNNYMQFSNFNGLYPLNDPYQWNTSYNDAIIAFSIGIGPTSDSDFYTGGGLNPFSLEDWIDYMIGLGLEALETALSGVLEGHPHLSLTGAPYDVLTFQSVHSTSMIKVRSETDFQVYAEHTPHWTERDRWVASNVIKNGEPQPMYRLTNLVTKKDMSYIWNPFTSPSSPHTVTQTSYSGNDSEHWVFIKYHPWWNNLPRYNLVNVKTGFYMTRVPGTDNLGMQPSWGSPHGKQLWYAKDY